MRSEAALHVGVATAESPLKQLMFILHTSVCIRAYMQTEVSEPSAGELVQLLETV